ncbi:MAG TPA: glycerophosphodiester phosphodiesterase family protein [bacterium]|mgnify:CR=1 FL=1|nr:glycerophosphodiester phosphodiesterase family protein [bacterium]
MKNRAAWLVSSFIILFAVVFALQAEALGEAIETVRPNLKVMKIAHRGATEFAPENTIPSFEKAIEIGFDYVEIDVRYTKDGIPVLMHDPAVDRTTDGTGKVADMTLEELKKLDAGAKYGDGSFKGTPVPTLEEVLIALKGRMGIYLDHKEMPKKITVDLINKYAFEKTRLIVYSDLDILLAFRELDPMIEVMPWGVYKIPDIDEMLKKLPHPTAFNIGSNTVERAFVDRAHELGIMVFKNTLTFLDTPPQMQLAIKEGVDAIQTDHQKALLKVIAKMKKANGANKEK